MLDELGFAVRAPLPVFPLFAAWLFLLRRLSRPVEVIDRIARLWAARRPAEKGVAPASPHVVGSAIANATVSELNALEKKDRYPRDLDLLLIARRTIRFRESAGVAQW